MKTIIYGLNFKPEMVGTGKYNGELADYLHQKGYDVRVITSPKYYPEWKSSRNKYYVDNNYPYKVYRCPLYVPKSPNGITRILHLISFSITSLPILLSQLFWKPDYIILVVPTLFCAPNIFIFKLLSFKKIFTILQIKDFELDAAFNLGILKGELLKSFLGIIEKFIFSNFNTIGTISYGMINKLHLKGINKNKTFYFPDWVDTNLIKQKKLNDEKTNIFRKKYKIPSKTIVIQYSGTMNKKQGFEFLAPIIKSFKDRNDILWLFGGEGPTKQEFVNSMSGITNIKFLPFQKESELSDWLNTGDIHIIPQNEEVEDLLFPSKLLAILASGNPVVSNTSARSELGKVIQNAGFRVNPKDKIGFINAIKILTKDKKLRISYGLKARKIAVEYYGKDKVLERFDEFLKKRLEF